MASPRIGSPLMPRSPSNINANMSPSRAKSLAMRKSISKPSTQPPPPQQSQRPDPDFDMAEQMNEEISNKYVKGKKLGEGTYAIVYKGHLRSDPHKTVAIKKFKVDPSQQREGLNVDTIREIKYLQEISHPSIVALLDVFSSKDQNINMVIEYFPNGNLEELIRDKTVSYGAADVKAWMGMLCRAIYYCHSNFVLHRDIKPNNLLIAADGEVKLADFGLARSFGDPRYQMTSAVITLWYRPPELLFGARQYGGAVDMWSIGMVFAELLIRRPYAAADVANQEVLATGGGTVAQLDKICEAVGTPNEENWPGVSKLRDYFDLEKKIPVRDKSFYMQMFPTAGSVGVDLLMAMLKLDPRKRVTARGALEHEWWTVDPRPTEKEHLPKQGGGASKMAAAEAAAPGAVMDENKFKGVAKKLDFGAARK
ncbi:TFIIH complex serine/threonine-protein kinase subunit kin28 [Exophiala dermatitidis]|nr:TFIIH complex serine/threonine-protein kinase subunit kin28 [Exophiala dermatitidis]KAJ4506316.1 TFIIH complex serine/threonine-protein kinase subunit kin28 [Exophiala dermatitidis]KAJ4506897.1 TFIIH complex serine/threonine-protein kinase subunit kin28 [Exophiala dermatitidis]KAJ4554126.1 TFIIH complex serine/threonine-protein kinase subunit kin28 [Exophiala dermatitidis]KAJ4580194.1 TFIIH complex serine/threonine-protein kinase subunit kin28 [Exophiala dermatitidis]